MNELFSKNLLHLFTFYLAAMFIVGTWRRLRQYHNVAKIMLAAPTRWPKLMQQIKKHWFVFLTWTTFRPAGLAIALLVIQSVCSRLIWPRATISINELLREWWMIPVIAICVGAMIAVDVYFLISVGQINRAETEKYLDEAEHWLNSWKAPLISTLTFGYINPRKIVDQEVQKALAEGQGMLNWALWWVSVQAGLRVLAGLSLWLSWALLPPI
jgi:hypothetical protein